MFNASNTLRLFMFNAANICLLGIYLTGFEDVHWVSYVLPAAFYLAAASGFCLGLITSKWILSAIGLKA